MMTLWLLCIVFTSITGFVFYKLYVRSLHARTQRVYECLATIQSLKDLMSRMQRHRGLTTRLLSGELRQHQSIEVLQVEVSGIVNKTESLDSSMEDNEAWLNLTRHWSKLSLEYKHLDVDNNIAQHTALIRTLLSIIDQISNSAQFRFGYSSQDLKLHSLWRELLIAAEHLGQVRAIGMSILSRGYASASSRRKLVYISNRVKESCELAWINQRATEQQVSLLAQIMLTVAQDLQEEFPQIDPEYFFDLCSKLIDSLFVQYDELIEHYRESQI